MLFEHTYRNLEQIQRFGRKAKCISLHTNRGQPFLKAILANEVNMW